MTPAALTIVVLALGLAAASLVHALRLRAQLAAERRSAAVRGAEREALAREQAAASERERIHADLHDDLGARLLGLIHDAQTPQQADRARALLQDLRDVVTRSRGTPGTLADVLADIRNEATQRLAAVDIVLDWHSSEALPDPPLDHARALHLHRIVREAISNVIRHAQARHVRVRVDERAALLRLELTDDGSGAGVNAPAAGSGLRGMRERAAELAGGIDWTAGTAGGTKVLLTMPLAPVPGA
ncbi:MAG: ATP-binding protein [Xanthomonadales bacterium]|nr:ATP-binding protein [Xanthomonadales bacterium]MDL1869659.1 ATP-binding protein [Gammaproteobacteria bacterium PRO6]